MDAIHEGSIKSLYVLGENPAMSDPNVEHARDALAALEHLVVQDIFLTETPKEVFAEMKLSMHSLDNITWERLEKEAVTYPSLDENDPGQPIVFADGFPRKEGRAKFTPASVIAPAEVPDEQYPMILITGRQLEHWHTGSMTRRATVLDALEPEANCSLHPRTLRAMGAEAGDKVCIKTRRGAITVMARSDRAVAEGQVFMPFAYVEAAANTLTNQALDPFGKIPEFKYSAASVSLAESDSEAAV